MPSARRGREQKASTPVALPHGGQPQSRSTGLLASGSSSDPPSRRNGGFMDRRPPIQLRGSAGFSPASRASNATRSFTQTEPRRQPWASASLTLDIGMAGITFITGGARSGKSTQAITLAMGYPDGRRYFLATAEPRDHEMAARIERHRRDRADSFVTIEEPVEITRVIESIADRAEVIVIDCLTLWLANLMDRGLDDERIMQRVQELVASLSRAQCCTIVVSGEVGLGIVPENSTARGYRDLLGWANQRIVKVADRAILMVAGCSLALK